MTDTFEIDVAASVIADISAGIYRTPAGALKELISNAFDADATHVRISTSSPHFRTFTCSDDGLGMTEAHFRDVMSHIGGSSKRDSSEYSPTLRRPLIGRIGIGILSIGQICKRFEIFSSAKGAQEMIHASIDLEPYMRPEARRRNLGETLSKTERVKIGTAEIEAAPEDADAHYTRVVMKDIHDGFREQLKSGPMTAVVSPRRRQYKPAMTDFVRAVSKDTVAGHGAYAQLLWDLAVTSPLRYMDAGPVVGEAELQDIRRRMENYDFRVFVDGMEILNPICFAADEERSKVYPHLDLVKELSDRRRLTVRGYLYWQNSRILPRELQGILVRVRNVGIGTFDPTYLDYPRHEGWKFSQLCGELYVDDGLDEAINIDRASFRETDEAYTSLQTFLFQRLGRQTDEGAGIFTDIKSRAQNIAQRKRAKESRRRRQKTSKALYGEAREIKLFATKAETVSGVHVGHNEVAVDEGLAASVPARDRELFIAVCGLVEKYLSRDLTPTRRRNLLERIAELFSAR
jgi:hypothetical protein